MKTVLAEEREKRGLSREQLARKIGITSEAVRLLESGKRKPSYDVLIKLLDLFGYSDPRKLLSNVQLDNNTTEK